MDDDRTWKPDRHRQARNAIDEMIRNAESTGDLAHMYGKPIDLSEDSSEWLVNRFVKEAGFSHPMLEQSKELDRLQTDLGGKLDRLARKRERLVRSGYGPLQAQDFNEDRRDALAAYRQALQEANRAILTFNIGAPMSLHRRTYNVDRLLAEAEQSVPSLPYSPREVQPRTTTKRSFLRRFRRRS
jgi:hypothetical protein